MPCAMPHADCPLQLLALADKDQDGTLTAAEVADRLDTDGDGVIEVAEFIASLVEVGTSPADARRIAELIDANHDGMVSTAELSNLIQVRCALCGLGSRVGWASDTHHRCGRVFACPARRKKPCVRSRRTHQMHHRTTRRLRMLLGHHRLTRTTKPPLGTRVVCRTLYRREPTAHRSCARLRVWLCVCGCVCARACLCACVHPCAATPALRSAVDPRRVEVMPSSCRRCRSASPVSVHGCLIDRHCSPRYRIVCVQGQHAAHDAPDA